MSGTVKELEEQHRRIIARRQQLHVELEELFWEGVYLVERIREADGLFRARPDRAKHMFPHRRTTIESPENALPTHLPVGGRRS